MPARKLDLDLAVGLDGPGHFETGTVHNLNRQEARRVRRSLRRFRRIAPVTQPFKIMLAFNA